MKGKLTWSRLLHNNKAMLICSIILAIVIWVPVAYNSNDTKTINKTVTIGLDNTYAESIGLKIYSGASQQVLVKMNGTMSALTKLTEEDITVNGDFSEVKDAGTHKINLEASVKSDEVKSIYVMPSTAVVMCDYPQTITLPVETDMTGISVQDSDNTQLGTPVVSSAGISNNTVTISGPKTEISQITKIIAKPNKPRTISEVTTFTGTLTALDKDGQKLSITHCTVEGAADNTVNITVPIYVHRQINFTYNLKNLPSSYAQRSDFVTVSPQSVVLVGTPEVLDSYAAAIQNLGTFDFNTIDLSKMSQSIALNIPTGMTVLDGTKSVNVTFNSTGMASKTLDLMVSQANSQAVNVPSGSTASVTVQKISNITLVGNQDSINAITEANLFVVVDLQGAKISGAVEKAVTISVNGYTDVWVYYGSNGYKAYVKIE